MNGRHKDQNAYQYQDRLGIRPVSWEDFHGLCKALAVAIDRDGADLILAIGRGGYYPGTLIAQMLQLEIYPVRLSRRVNDIVRYESPRWILPPQQKLVKDRRAVIVDEICDSGETLTLVKEQVRTLEVDDVKCAVLYAHTRNISVPDYIGLITDELIINPWDREILIEGVFQFHPEYKGALTAQGIEPDESLRIQTHKYRLAKST
jgi:hypoxanthine phosphoribosyltransferase